MIEIPYDIERFIPSSVRLSLERMSPERQSLFLTFFKKNIRNPTAGVLFAIFKSGSSFVYRGKVQRAFLFWSMGIPIALFNPKFKFNQGVAGMILFGIVVAIWFIWWLTELFYAAGHIQKENEALAISIIELMESHENEVQSLL
ncbi:hypothetical protein PVA44_04775 [Entomospira nematocerorum]|uniref:Uncharacterized protein n=1 Tax=Entomospira nematocerorum TaxID=2719987 RepID=A0A968KSK7_9SPIO|nr:hypothetical protein [Entomospira nematocera]NIZ46665.1 hypothetical protein [Entomospira nematocera]WDI33538.1 hypothetical protein PVA44_04775 [Entomospira nematocera]